jgi:hypothetical protein
MEMIKRLSEKSFVLSLVDEKVLELTLLVAGQATVVMTQNIGGVVLKKYDLTKMLSSMVIRKEVLPDKILVSIHLRGGHKVSGPTTHQGLFVFKTEFPCNRSAVSVYGQIVGDEFISTPRGPRVPSYEHIEQTLYGPFLEDERVKKAFERIDDGSADLVEYCEKRNPGIISSLVVCSNSDG